jgi:hypothetical protein
VQSDDKKAVRMHCKKKNKTKTRDKREKNRTQTFTTFGWTEPLTTELALSTRRNTASSMVGSQLASGGDVEPDIKPHSNQC